VEDPVIGRGERSKLCFLCCRREEDRGEAAGAGVFVLRSGGGVAVARPREDPARPREVDLGRLTGKAPHRYDGCSAKPGGGLFLPGVIFRGVGKKSSSSLGLLLDTDRTTVTRDVLALRMCV
jgi:hypothetical protein